MYDVSLRRIRAQLPFEGFEGSYFCAGSFRYHPLTEFNLRMAISLNLVSGEEASWAWEDLLYDQHWESVRLHGQLQWMLERTKPSRICVIRDGDAALQDGQHYRLLQSSGYSVRASNRVFERWILRKTGTGGL